MANGYSMVSRNHLRQPQNVNNMKNKIKELRAKLNITQEELAKEASVRRETIVFLEQGKYNPSLQLAYQVAKALKTNINDLFNLKY